MWKPSIYWSSNHVVRRCTPTGNGLRESYNIVQPVAKHNGWTTVSLPSFVCLFLSGYIYRFAYHASATLWAPWWRCTTSCHVLEPTRLSRGPALALAVKERQGRVPWQQDTMGDGPVRGVKIQSCEIPAAARVTDSSPPHHPIDGKQSCTAQITATSLHFATY